MEGKAVKPRVEATYGYKAMNRIRPLENVGVVDLSGGERGQRASNKERASQCTTKRKRNACRKVLLCPSNGRYAVTDSSCPCCPTVADVPSG